MKEILYYFLQVLIISGLLYIYYHCFLRNNKFHRYNRFYLLGATIVSLIIPFLKIPLNYTSEEANASILYRSMQFINGQEEIIIKENNFSWEQIFNWQNISILLYAFITLFILIRLIIALKRIIRLRYQYPSARIENIQFIKTTEPGTPFSFFNWLFWNKKIEVQSEKGQQIFRHEWFHIQQKHSVDIMFMELLNVLYWFNPFFYLVKKELKTIHEFLADEFAVQHFSKGEYAELLLMQAFDTEHKIVNPFFHTQIKRRIAMITTSSKPGYQYLRKIMALPVCALVITLFAFTYQSKEILPALSSSEKITVVIDAGHGGNDGGVNATASIFEKDINLELAKAVAAMNQDPNIEIVLTRESDESIPLQNRTEIAAKRKADLFISLHVGAAGPMADGKINEKKNGIEVIVSRKNKTFDLQNRALASYMISQFEKTYTTNKSILVKETGIRVLDKNNCPSILIECGYLTNPGDLSFITQKENQQKIAKSILAGIHQYAKEKNNLLSAIHNQALNDTIPVNTKPLIVIDGVIKENAEINDTDPSNIQSINVLKDKSALTKYGDKGKNGVIEITTHNKSIDISSKVSATKPALSTTGKPVLTIKKVNNGDQKSNLTTTGIEKPNPLFVIDGEEQTSLKSSKLNEKISPDDVESINVLKGESAIKKYGEKGKNGVIEITSKKHKKASDNFQQ